MLYGFPGDQSYPGFMTRLGWHDLGRLPELIKMLNPKAMIESRTHSATVATMAEKPASLLLRLWKGEKRHKPSGRVQIRNMDGFDRRFDDLWLKSKEPWGQRSEGFGLLELALSFLSRYQIYHLGSRGTE